MNMPEIPSRILCGTALLKICSYALGNKVSLVQTTALSAISVLSQECILSRLHLDRTWLGKSLSFLAGSAISVVVVGAFSKASLVQLGYLHILPTIGLIVALTKFIFWIVVLSGLGFYVFGPESMRNLTQLKQHTT